MSQYDATYQREYRATHKDEKRIANRRDHLMRAYGLTLEEREAMGNTCALCGKSQERMAVDHCHTTGKIRGILCLRCNGALGTLGDSAEALQRVLTYLHGAA